MPIPKTTIVFREHHRNSGNPWVTYAWVKPIKNGVDPFIYDIYIIII